MENIYKIKIKTNPDPQGLYPSERRYSASTVLGLGVVHLALAATALLLACISIMTAHHEIPNNTTHTEFMLLLVNTQNPLQEGNTTNEEMSNNTTLSIAPCLMSIGALAAGLTALLAWKRWYIDHNIRWFFIMSSVSSITSAICLVLTALIIASAYEMERPPDAKNPHINLVLAINIFIASVVEVIWSTLSTKIAFRGMNNTYPDDIVISKSRGGRIEVNTIHKGNKKGKIVPPDILNHFPVTGKLSKYFPKKGISDLAKTESNQEYQERVNKFLSSNTNANNGK